MAWNTRSQVGEPGWGAATSTVSGQILKVVMWILIKAT